MDAVNGQCDGAVIWIKLSKWSTKVNKLKKKLLKWLIFSKT